MLLNPLTIRQVRLLELAAFVQAVEETLAQAGLEPAKVAEVVKSAVSARCLECQTQFPGESFHLLAQPEDAPGATSVKRLRLGYCLHPGCGSIAYQLEFKPVSGIDWTTIIAEAEAIKAASAPGSRVSRPPLARLLARKDWWRMGLATLLLALLLVARQWYVGGRIPLLREPEKFRVDPAPEQASNEPD